MAAGGSAPELATSVIGTSLVLSHSPKQIAQIVHCTGTFQRSDIGFGTIVGSAVFNVLFVIGMCAFFTPKEMAPLHLTWWPLARDCSFYVLTLSTLVIFMWDGKIVLWESIIQFCLYLVYVAIMLYSERMESWLKLKFDLHVSESIESMMIENCVR